MQWSSLNIFKFYFLTFFILVILCEYDIWTKKKHWMQTFYKIYRYENSVTVDPEAS